MRSSTLRTLCFCVGLAAPLAAAGQPAFPVKDISTVLSGGGGPLSPRIEFVDFQGLSLFTISDGVHGIELWRSDGTPAGTRLVKDICPGACSSRPSALTVSGGQVFFGADDGAHGFELWKTDGTEAGTTLVQEMTPGLKSTWIIRIESLGDSVLVFENHPGGPTQWWSSDGTPAGTVPLSFQGTVVGRLGDTTFLSVPEHQSYGAELWKTDGTEAGTGLLKDIHPGIAGSYPGLGTVAGGKLFFPILSADSTSQELWVTDGTEEGTVHTAPIESDPNHLYYQGRLVTHGSNIFFPSWDSTRGLELWKSNGTAAGTVPVKDINPGASGSFSLPGEMVSALGKLFFIADDGTHGAELWMSDGTEAGTVLVEDVRPGAASAFDIHQPVFLKEVSGRLVFFAHDGTHGIEPWTSDGTAAGTSLLADLVPGPDSSYLVEPGFDPNDRFAVAGSWFYFRPHLGPEDPEIWITDGTAAGTGPLLEIDTQTSSLLNPRPGVRTAADFDGILVFQANDGATGFEPWRSDGTAAGTFLVEDLLTGPESSYPDNFTRRENTNVGTMLFRSFSPVSREALWKTHTNAEEANPVSFIDSSLSELTPFDVYIFFTSDTGLWRSDTSSFGTIRTGPESLTRNLTAAAGQLFYTRIGPTSIFEELWKSDGFNTSAVLPVSSGGPSGVGQLTPAGNLLFFSAIDGQQLWKSDGTEAGTVFLRGSVTDQFAIPQRYDTLFPSDIRDQVLATAGSTLLFAASDSVSGAELWKSDGTVDGTVLVKDIVPGTGGSEPLYLTSVGDRVYFVADDGVHGRELWVSDGTEAGTRMVADLLPGAGSSLPEELSALGHVLLFSATDGVHGREPWRSNGSPGGTRRVADVAPDAVPSSPFAFTPSGENVYFAASDGTTGFELWAAPKPSFLVTFGDVPMSHWAWSQIEAVAAAGITQGCSSTEAFCPDRTLTRAEVAVFLGRALHGPAFVPPPATGTRFGDVPAPHWAGAWIEQIATDGITQGCSASPPLFCPGAQLSRAEMAIFLLRAKHGGSYAPPPATVTRFEDVPATHWAASWIEQLAAEGISLGCTATRFCPGNLVTRAEMAVFLDRAFGLSM